MTTIQSLASTLLMSLIRVYILMATKQVAKLVNMMLTVIACVPREDMYVPSFPRLKIPSRSCNMSM
jgi:hypothetical protein